MFKNYFKTSLRSLSKKKSFGFLNILGLSIGIACASFIFLWVENELHYNHSYKKIGNLYKVYENQTYDGKISTFHATPGPMAVALKSDIPGIKNTARMSGMDKQLFSMGDKSINEPGDYADAEIFSMLELTFRYGQPNNAFPQTHTLVLSESMSRTFFGDADPTGKTLKMNNDHDFIITGVFRDLPKNSTFQFHWLAPMENIEHVHPWQQLWGANWANTYVELEPSANPEAVNAKLSNYLSIKGKNSNKTTCFLFAMNDWNLRDNFIDGKQAGGRIQYVRLFTIIAWIILLTACINFMNLTTAQSEKRSKEVGVRKVMGARKTNLIFQFLGEAIWISFIATLLAVGLMYLIMPYFNLLVAGSLELQLTNPSHIFYLLSISLITGLIAGSYPALYLSSFNPIVVLKGFRIKSNIGHGFIRQGLVVVQFSISIILIISTVIIFQQIQHVKTRDMGYNKNNLVYISTQGKLDLKFNSLYDDLKKTGKIEDAGLSDYPILQIWNNTDNFHWKGKDPSTNPLITWENINAHFISTAQIKLLAGRDFNEQAETDSNSIIINASLAGQMGKEGRIGGILMDGDRRYQIVGIVKDFLYNTMYEPGAPLLFYNHPQGTQFLTMRIKNDGDIKETLEKIGQTIQKNNPAYPVELKFIDQDFNQLFNTELLTGKLSSVFSILAILISCLGLFGLAAYSAERRIKEIGVRKVLGASVFSLTRLLSKEFLILVVLACLIAFPISWWAINYWLQTYAYRVDIYWWVFATAGVLAAVIALSTISFQTIKAALMNPIRSLRSE